jgi:hypothetical protein
VQRVTKYQKCGIKRDKYFDNEVETQLREKLFWAAKPKKSTIRRQSQYIDSNTHIPDAAIVSSTLTRNPM